MNKHLTAVALCALGLSVAAAPVAADTVSFQDAHKFISDLQPPATLTVPAFDTLGGTLTLTNVVVDVYHWASVELRGDNDDPFNTATVRGRMIRQWSLTGPGVVSGGNQMVMTPFVNLAVDDGDGGDPTIFDFTPPDGVDFGTLSYGPLLASSHNPAFGPYTDTGTVDFEVTPLLMVNDQQFVTPPDAWQLEVQNPSMTIEVVVTYHYVPEPTALAMLGFAGVVGLLRRKRAVAYSSHKRL